MRNVLVVAALIAAPVLGLNADTAGAQTLNGAGSTFVDPILSKWAREYEKAKEVKIKYNSVGSGAGVRQLLEKEIDFACADAPLTDEQMVKANENGGAIHVPLVLGGVVVAYNLKEAKEPVRFNGPVLADIFLGNIKKWNDPALKELNPSLDLPDEAITVVTRSDASGTTAIFADYLGKVNREFKDKAGSGTSVKWPVGTGVRGTEEVAEAVKGKSGAIGYVELLYALKNKLPTAKIKNKEGSYVQGTLETVTAAGENLADVPDDLRFSLTNLPGKDSYPIVGATWAVVYVKNDEARAKRLVEFLNWTTHDGQESATDLFYARVPKGLVAKADEKLKSVGVVAK